MNKLLMMLLGMCFLATSVLAQGTKIVPIWSTTGYDNTGIKTLRGPVDSSTGLRLDTMLVMLDFRNVFTNSGDSGKVHVIVDTIASNGVAPHVDVDVIPATYNNVMQSSVDLGTAVNAIDSCTVGVASSQTLNTKTIKLPVSRLVVIRVYTTTLATGGEASVDTIGFVTVKGWIEAPMK